jgi:HD-GYP domain-containing protein (c-di-GMP phosphodiesterase class II)
MQIPDEILNKPARLTGDEFKVMKQHPEIGRKLLMKS